MPKELKIYIISYLANAQNLTDLIKTLKSINVTSKEFHEFAQSLIKEFAKNYVSKYPNKAKVEFFNAIETGKISVVKALIEAGINVNSFDSWDRPALVMAASNSTEIAKMLLDKGADINQKNSFGATALSMAVKWGYPDVVQFLIDQGANVNIENDLGVTPLMAAVNISDPG